MFNDRFSFKRFSRLTLLRTLAMSLLAVLLTASFSFAQTTWYVNSTNGDDALYNGLSAIASGGGVGPYLTIAKAISSASDGDTVKVAAGAYGEANVNITKSLSFVAYLFQSNTVATITNGITINGSGKTVNIGLPANESVGFNVGSTATALVLTAGTLNIASANMTIASSGTITRTNGTINAAPTTSNVNVTYGVATASLTAGPEVPASLGSGVLTVGNTGNGVTFPQASISGSGQIVVSSGNATFSGNIVLTAANFSNTGTGTVAVGGTVAMNGTSVASPGNIVNSNTGTLNLNGAVTSDQTSSANAPGVILNSSTGTLNANGLVTWMAYAQNFGTVISNSNAGAGTMSFTAGVVFQKASTGAANPTGLISNAGTGTLTISNLTETSATITAVSYAAVISLTNASTGTVNIAGTVNGAVVNDAAGTIALSGAATFSGTVSNNNAASVIKLGTNTLTVSGGPAIVNPGHIISSTAGTVGSGTLAITGSAATISGGGELPNLSLAKSLTFAVATTIYGVVNTTGGTLIGGAGLVEIKSDLDISSGGLTVGAGNVQVDGNINQSGGAITDGGNTLFAKGNLTMTGGAYSAPTGTLAFTSGTATQTFTPITNLVLNNLTVNSAGQTVALGASVIIMSNATITAGTIDVTTFNIRMDGTGTFTNTGGYVSSGGGTLIFENAGAGVIGTITGAGVFSNLDVRGAAGGSVQLGSAVTLSGTIYLRNGDLDLNGHALTLNSSLVRPAIQKNTLPTTAGTAIIENTGAGGNLVTVTTDYDLTYYGSASWVIAATEYNWAPAKLHSLTIATGDATHPFTVTPPAGALTLTGNLTVNADQTLSLTNAGTLTATGASAAHSVIGTITLGTFDITGNSATLTGAATTAGAATVNILQLDGTSVKVLNLQNITGNLTINAAGDSVVMNTTSAAIGGNVVVNTPHATDAVTLTLASTAATFAGNLTITNGALTLTMGSVAAQQKIAGNATLTAGSLILGTNLEVVGTTSQVAGNIVLGANNYQADAVYTRSGAGTVTGTGKLILAYAVSGNFDPGSTFTIANLQVNTAAGQTVTLLNPLTVSGLLTLTQGTVATNGQNLTVSGSVTAASTFGSITGTGNLILTGSKQSVTLGLNLSVDNLTFNVPDTITITTNDLVTPTYWNLTVRSLLTHTAGIIKLVGNALSSDNIILTNIGATDASYIRTAGGFIMTSGELEMNGANGNGTFTPGVGLSIANLQFVPAVTVAGTNVFTVTNFFKFAGNVTFSQAGILSLASGSTIYREGAGTLSKLPAFPANNNINVQYDAAVTTDLELPAVVNNLTTTVGAVVLNAPVTVNGTFAVGGVFTNATAKNVTLGAGAYLEMNTGGSLAIAVIPPTSGLINLIYNGGPVGGVTTANDWPATANINTLQIWQTVTLGANRTVQGTVTVGATVANQNLNLGGFTLTVLGNVTTVKGGNFGAAGTVAFSGSANDTLTLDANKFIAAGVTINIAKTAAANTVTLMGANLDFSDAAGDVVSVLTLTKGIILTGANVVILGQSNNGLGQPAQGFTKTDTSYVYGNVQKFLNIIPALAGVNLSQIVYPVGTAPSAGTPGYRPLILYFTTLPQSSINLTATFVGQSPGGSNGFPIAAGTKNLTGYPPFYWFLKPDQNIAQTYIYNMEAQAQGYNSFYTQQQIQNVRFVRRDSGSVNNQWTLQGTDANYVNAILGDGSPDIRVNTVQGGISLNGTFFTYSVQNVPPHFISLVGAKSVGQLDTLKFTLASQDSVNNTVLYSAIGLPKGATLNDTTGAFMWVPSYTQVGLYNVTFKVTDPFGAQDSQVVPITVTVTYVMPVLVSESPNAFSTLQIGSTLKFSVNVTDANPSDTLTYAWSVNGTAVSSHDSSAFTTTFPKSDSGNVTVKVVVTDLGGLSVNHSWLFLVTAVNEISGPPKAFALGQNYPNPFNPSTVVRFDVKNTSYVRLVIYDILGREVRTLVNDNMAAGSYTATWDGLNDHGQQVGSGIYLYKMDAGQFTSVKKMILLK